MTEPARADQLLPAVGDAEFNRKSSGDQVAAYIRRLIFTGHLRHGDRIRQDVLAAALGVSRIPVREAIIALDREGWVTSEPHRGAYVNGFDRNGIADHYEMVGLLYGLTARRVTERADDEALERMSSLQKSMQRVDDPDEFSHLNEQLIRAMFVAAGSPRLGAVSRVMTPVVPGNFFAAVPGAINDQKRGVARVVKALVARDAAGAAEEWQKLLHRHAEHVIEMLADSGLLPES